MRLFEYTDIRFHTAEFACVGLSTIYNAAIGAT
jgi:hypothetical protein